MPPDHMTAEEVMAHFTCRTKAALIAKSISPEQPENLADLFTTYRASFRAAGEKATGRTVIEFHQLPSLARSGGRYMIDALSAFVEFGQITRLDPTSSNVAPRTIRYAPTFYYPFDPLPRWHTDILYFAAAAIEIATGFAPASGYVCFGLAPTIKAVRLGRYLQYMTVIKEIVVAHRVQQPPPLELNSHCPICQFNMRCRKQAIEDDNLSLVTSIPPKERRKLEAKGITTISQLSYTYRPRRKHRAHATPRPVNALMTNKNDHRLKALAIRKKQVHILNVEPVTALGTPVYFDVEGIPGTDQYYLVGLRFRKRAKWHEYSFWADDKAGERTIWKQLLATLDAIPDPQLVHYGSYESVYLARMRERYPETLRKKRHLESQFQQSRNLLKSIYASIYFPTFTNGLKGIAGYLGFTWSDPTLTGPLASLLRLQWEIAPRGDIKQRLIRYNMDDCRAAQIVADAIGRYQREVQLGTISTPNLVDIDSLKVPYQRTYGPFASTSADFHRINGAAYWNYQRERVFVRSGKHLARRSARTTRARKRNPPRPDKVVYVARRPLRRCPKCRWPTIWKAGCQSQTVIDLAFSRKGIRRQIVRQRVQRYRCAACREEMGPPRQKTRTGPHLEAYILYLMMEMRLSNSQIAKQIKDLFKIDVDKTFVHTTKERVANRLEPLYRRILKSIAQGSLVHVDETKGVVLGGGHYVWVFTNLTSVAFVYSPGRDPHVLTQTLDGFQGVLVSDFYAAYDSVPCVQQKCLIHLMRDINETMKKSPFNQELSAIATGFGTLLRSIVETIDRWGLKSRYLRKHKRDVRVFYHRLKTATLTDDTAVALRKRFLKNEGRLFTFLDQDDVPWNNNNAEHALRAFTKLRNSMATSTAKGTREYAILLSVQQTLKYRNMDFLTFLLSQSTHIDGLV
jgi:predicted RecB family nuclease